MKIRYRVQFHQEWFLLLSPAFIVIKGFCRFPDAIDWIDALLLFLEYTFWSFIISLLLSFFLSFRKAAFFTFLLVLFNSVYSGFYEYATEAKQVHFFTRFGFIFPCMLAMFLLLFLFLRRTAYKLNKSTRFLNFVFLLFIGIELLQFGLKTFKQQQRDLITTTCKKCDKPDVYLIITDGYAGRKQLQEQFQYNNSGFEDSLRKLGMYIVDSSFSNYGSTGPSTASLLNMQYGNITSDDDIHHILNNNQVVQFFGSINYRIVNHSIFKINGEFPAQPVTYFKTGTVLITHHSFFSHLKQVVHNLLYEIGIEQEKNRVNNIRKQIALLERGRDSLTMQYLLATIRNNDPTPKFVYSHFMMPHPPYLFDKNGNYSDEKEPSEIRYISYLQYTNNKLLNIVRSIIKKSSKPPLILLISDHGYRNDEASTPTPLRFYNFSAVYIPANNFEHYYKGLSIVNQFRIFLNHQFGQKLPLLKDSTVY